MNNPSAPSIHHAPLAIAPETFLVRQLQGEGHAPVSVYINSLVIRGREPVIVDTGTKANRKQWLEDVFSLVDPRDVKWVYLSHDDSDHTGNLAEVMARCPNATLVCNWFMVERMSGEFEIPLPRCRWVDDGEAFDAGDRILTAVVPPTYDAPTTRGLFDASTGLYWASDSFAMPVPVAVDDASDVAANAFREGFSMFQRVLSPWMCDVDASKWARRVERVRSLDAKTIAGAHGPVLRGERLAEAFELMLKAPAEGPARTPGQAVLEQILAQIAGAPARAA